MTSLASLADRIRAAAADQQPLRIRGGGTKDFYGERLEGEILDTRPLAGIVSYEPSELVVTVRAGTPLADLDAALGEKGQVLAFEPPYFARGPGGGATVGGMVASGLAGPARAATGSVRDFVLGVQIVNGRGELLSFGGQVMKNVAGYDVSRLMAGSLGTLALIAEVSLKVLPRAPAEATLRFAGLDEGDMIRRVNTWGGQPLPLNASSWVHDAHDTAGPALYLRLRGAVAAVEAACSRLLRELPGERLHHAQVAADWQAARDLALPWFAAGFARGDTLWRLSVPPVTPPLNVGSTLVDWFGAQRWVFVAPDDADHANRLRHAAALAGGHAQRFRTASGEARGERVDAFDPLRAPLDRIHRALKREFDPAGIFNRGRLYPDL